jgi:aarF domain-containing kinase
MEYIEGCHIDQLETIKGQSLNLKKIGKIFSNVMIKMIHKEGFVHADPHSGNLMIRKKKNGEAELVLLDHGIYQELN